MKHLFAMLLVVSFAFGVQASEVDLEKSTLQWTGSKITGSFHTGKLFSKEMKVVAPKGVIESAKIVIDMSSFTVTDLTGGTAKKFLGHMKSDDFFSVATYPTATLNITSIKNGEAVGDLTIKNKTNPVRFKVQRIDTTYTGQLKFDRTKFGMIYGSGSFFKNLGDKVISDEVVVDFKIVLKPVNQKASL